MGETSENERLSAAIDYANRRKPKNAKKRRGFTSASASKFRKMYLKDKNFMPTRTMRIHSDAIILAKAAWPQCNERVKECSAAIRDIASKKLGISRNAES